MYPNITYCLGVKQIALYFELYVSILKITGSLFHIYLSKSDDGYMLLYTQACCVEFLILEGDNMSALFPNAGVSIKGFEVTALQTFTILAAVIILPTVWIRDLSLLSYVSGKNI